MGYVSLYKVRYQKWSAGFGPSMSLTAASMITATS